MRDLGILLAAIVRKAASRADQDPLAMELKELAERAEAIVGEIATSRLDRDGDGGL